MIKNNKGITMLALVITVILLILLAAVSMDAGYLVVKDIRIGRIISNMSLVKAKAETIYEQYQFSGNNADLVGARVEGIDFLSEKEIELIEQNAENNDFANWSWYEWGQNTLEEQGLDYNMLKEDEHFYVNYEYGEIIYSKGTSYTTSGTKYFSMTGLNYLYKNH